jgi:DNA replication protein DnaC
MLDDGGLAPLHDENRRDWLEIIADRHDCRATLVTSSFPVEHWHEALGNPPLADAILDRLVHHAYMITLQGESMRQRQALLTRGAPLE